MNNYYLVSWNKYLWNELLLTGRYKDGANYNSNNTYLESKELVTGKKVKNTDILVLT